MELEQDHNIEVGYHMFVCPECGASKRCYSYLQLIEGGWYDA